MGKEPGMGKEPSKGQEPGMGKDAGMGQEPGQQRGMGKEPGKGEGDGMGKEPGSAKGKGEPSDKPPQGEANAEQGASGGKVTNNQKGFDPREGERQFLKTAPRQGPFQRDRSTWQSLPPRERAALIERYVRELPLEYRGVLKAYYEALAK
jgi:hypothetical protein